MEKNTIIIFEGPDKTGKTTLLNAFNKATDFSYLVLDRLTISSKVYNKLFNRNQEKYYKEIEESFCEAFNVLLVYCYCYPEDNERRLQKSNEKLPKSISSYEAVAAEFEKQIKESKYSNVLELNTSMYTIEYCVERIKKRVEANAE